MQLSVQRLFSDPPLVGGLPLEPRFTPDGRAVAFLRTAADDRERLDLWRHEIATGISRLWVSGARLAALDAPPTDAEKAERERRRQFSRGITRFQFSPDGARLLLPVAGAGYLLDLEDDTLALATPSGTRQTDFQFDPRGQRLSYVRDGDLYLLDLEHHREQRLTHDGGGTVSNGIADFIAQEEMHRFEGHWWSPDGRFLAWTRVDEAPIAVSQRYEIDADEIRVIAQRYPYAGAANATVRLIVRDLETGHDLEVPWQIEPEDYLARVVWWDQRLIVQAQSRDQRRITVRLCDVASGRCSDLFSEHSATWLNLHDNCRPVDPRRLLWSSERDGAGHLYLWQDGALRCLTAGSGRVNKILHADADTALVQGWFGNPVEQHVYRVALDAREPTAPEPVTRTAGWHDATVSTDGLRILDRHTALDDPGSLILIETPAARRTEPNTMAEPDSQALLSADPHIIAREAIVPGHPYHPFQPRHATPVLGTLTAADGQTLHYRLTRPVNVERPPGGHPVIVHVYGGPGVQRVRNEWAPLLLQLFNHHGYGVLELDNRGSGNRGPAFEAPIHRRLGEVEVRDQLLGVDFLRGLDWVDPTRIGVFGHSYGGYMAIMSLLKAPAAFRAAVAVAPVTDWTLYDTHYTERYLGTPAANADGYQMSSILQWLDEPWCDARQGRLLLIHGMADDNVLFTHSTRLYRALQARGLPFEMMAYPGAKHALQERDVSIHRFNLILDFFGRSL